MKPEQVIVPAIRQLARRPWVANRVFDALGADNPFSSERYVDPYPMLERMAAKGPVHFNRLFRTWFITGYDEAQELLRSPGTVVSGSADTLLSIRPYTELSDEARTTVRRWVLLTDPPDHTRLRGLVSRAFTPRHIASWEPRVETVASELLAALDGREESDVVAGFTARLPIHVIGDILGLSRDRWEWLKQRSDVIADMLDPFLPFDPAEVNRTFADLHAYFRALADERRKDPRDDLITVLVEAADGDALSDDELLSMIDVLMIAGHETTTGLLGNAIIALADHPVQRARFRDEAEIRVNAVEELIRFDTSVYAASRVATTDIPLGGQRIAAGDKISVQFAAANRDRRRWPDADQLRLDRESPRPLSFGHGIHHCIGAALARLEIRVGLGAFVESFGDYEVEPSRISWRRSGAIRGPESLPVRRQPELVR